jgi:hypothetical protein
LDSKQVRSIFFHLVCDQLREINTSQDLAHCRNGIGKEIGIIWRQKCLKESKTNPRIYSARG